MADNSHHEMDGKERFQFLDIPTHRGIDYFSEDHNEDDVDGAFAKRFIPLRSTSSKSQPTRSLSLSQSMKRKIYASTVSTESVYTKHKHQQGWKWKLFRRGFGVPLAVMYYFFLVWLFSDFILGKSSIESLEDTMDVAKVTKNICDVIFNKNISKSRVITKPERVEGIMLEFNKFDQSTQSMLQESFRMSMENVSVPVLPKVKVEGMEEATNTTSSQETKGGKEHILFENDSAFLHVLLAIVMFVVGGSSVYIRSVRATMLLILPGLITNRSRHIIFSIILGCLVNHPIRNIRLNIVKLLENTICMYRAAVALGCIKEKETKLLWKYGKDLHRAASVFHETFQNLRCAQQSLGYTCSKDSYGPNPFSNTTVVDFKTLTEPSTKGIKDKAHLLISKMAEFGEYIEVARKLFTVVSLLLLVIEVIRYLRSYYIDSSFDNVYVGKTTRKHWEKRNYYKQSLGEIDKYSFALWDEDKGLRHWEIKEGFKTVNLPKWSKWLCVKIFRNSISTFVFTAFVILVFVVDFFLIEVLQNVKDSQRFHLTLEGFTQNITESINAELRRYNTKSCLATPNVTATSSMLLISILLILALSSCILQVFLSGIRAKLCSIFYPDRVEERADFLYFKIVTGRINRNAELMLLVRREMEKRKKLLQISPLKRLKQLFARFAAVQTKMVVCPGCSRKVKRSKTKQLSLNMFAIEKSAEICNDCYLDLSKKYKLEVITSSSPN